jgi:hypothetical protein
MHIEWSLDFHGSQSANTERVDDPPPEASTTVWEFSLAIEIAFSLGSLLRRNFKRNERLHSIDDRQVRGLGEQWKFTADLPKFPSLQVHQ